MALSSRRVLFCALALSALAPALVLFGCGRRGDLEPPRANATVPQAQAPTATQPGAAATTTDKTQQKPDRPFILDPLLR